MKRIPHFPVERKVLYRGKNNEHFDGYDTFEYFMSLCQQFKLGALVTESSNRITVTLSQTLLRTDGGIAEGLGMLKAADVVAAAMMETNRATLLPQRVTLAQRVHRTLTAGKYCRLNRLELSVDTIVHAHTFESPSRPFRQ